MDELLARIRAALRRAHAEKADDEGSPVLDVGDFRLDLENRSVVVKGLEVHLTPKEYDLMVYLLSHPGKVLTHRTLLAAIWGGESVEQTEYLRVLIGQLRKKIEPDPATPQYIVTDPWIGYRFLPGDRSP
jgi:two-component system KDP operon response regulator KdpE